MVGFLSTPGEVRSKNLGSILQEILNNPSKPLYFVIKVYPVYKHAIFAKSKDMRYECEEV